MLKPIRYLLLSLSLVGSLLTVACAPERNNPFSEDSYLSLYEPEKMKVLAESNKLTLEERMMTLTSLRDAMKSSYVGYNLKKQLIGISGDEIFAQCFAAEQAVTADSYLQEFHTRLMKCVALFQDGHFNLKKFLTSEVVLSPIGEAAWLNNELYIVQIRSKIIDALIKANELDASAVDFIKKGSKIISIDGEKSEKALADFGTILSKSTKESVKKATTWSFFNRRNLYPSKPFAEIVIQNEDGTTAHLKIPWVSQTQRDKIETPLMLSELNIKNLSEFGEASSLTTLTGHDLDTQIYTDVQNAATYAADDKKVLTLGQVTVKNQQACYFVLNTFSLEKTKNTFLVTEQSTNSQVNLIDTLATFLTACGNKPLIADLRVNGGGNSALQDEISSLFEKNTNPVYAARAYLNNKGNSDIFSIRINGLDKAIPNAESINNFEALVLAKTENQDITSWVVTKKRTNKTDVFSGKILLLISPACVSACENFSNRLAFNKNAIVIGEETAGTGFGYSSGGESETSWRDPMNSFRLDLPNHAFNFAVSMNDGTRVEDQNAITGRLNFDQLKLLENNPIKPHIKYLYQPEDLNDFAGYKKIIEQNL